MKKNQIQTLLFIALIGLMSACKPALKLTDASMMIPNNAKRVMAFNPSAINQKLDKEQIGKMAIFKMLKEKMKNDNAQKATATLFKNINEAGIDFNKKIYLVTGDGQMNIYFLLSDPKKFNDFLKKEAKTEKGISYVREGEGENERLRIAWKGNLAILSMKQNNALNGLLKKNPLSNAETTPLSMQELFDVKLRNSILELPDFRKSLLETHDIIGFSPFGKSLFAKLLENESISNYAMSMTDEQQTALEKANVITYTDFNNGEIISKSTYNVDPSLTKDLSTLFGERVAPDMMPLLNHKNLLGTINLNFDFAGIIKLISRQKELPFDMNKRDSAFNGFSPADIIQAFGGSILAGVYSGDSAKLKIVVATKINNPDLVRSLLQKSVGKNIQQISENVYLMPKLSAIKPKKQPDIQEVEPAMPPDSMDDDAGGIGIDSLGNAVLLKDVAVDTTQVPIRVVDEQKEGSDTEMIPDLPSKRKASPFDGMKPDRLVLKGNLLFLTDSTMVESLQNGQFLSLTQGTQNNKLGEGQMNMYINFFNLIKALPPSVGMMTAMIGKFPIEDMHINMNGKNAFVRFKTSEENENSLLTILKTAERLTKLGGALKSKK